MECFSCLLWVLEIALGDLNTFDAHFSLRRVIFMVISHFR
jgi:hypothetical protein